MPPRRGVRRKKGGRVAGAAASSVLARGACGDLDDKHQEHVQYIEDLVQGLKDKVENKCDCIMNEQTLSVDALYRARARAKSSIPKQFREMNLAEYCANYGEDYDAILFHAMPPKEREALLAKTREDVKGDDDDDEEDDENDPGTIVKGRVPQAVPQTPSGRGMPRAGRATRSAMKTKPAALPATEGRQSRAVPSTPSGRGRPPSARIMRSAVKVKTGAYEPPTPESKDEPELPADFIAELHTRANPEHTVYDHLDAMIQRRIDNVPVFAAQRCEQLRRKLEEGSAILRATVPGVSSGGAASSGKRKMGGLRQTSPPGDGVKKGEEEEVVEAGGEEEGEEEEVVVGGPAMVKVSTEGGPYDGRVFELSLEEDGEARMLGRSSGKRFKQSGISLSKDSEVSITHGKFENSGGKVTFTDVGSTNGTEVDGEPAEKDHAYEMVAGSKLLIGQGTFTVTLTWGQP